jgi:hypothetical protein
VQTFQDFSDPAEHWEWRNLEVEVDLVGSKYPDLRPWNIYLSTTLFCSAEIRVFLNLRYLVVTKVERKFHFVCGFKPRRKDQPVSAHLFIHEDPRLVAEWSLTDTYPDTPPASAHPRNEDYYDEYMRDEVSVEYAAMSEGDHQKDHRGLFVLKPDPFNLA